MWEIFHLKDGKMKLGQTETKCERWNRDGGSISKENDKIRVNFIDREKRDKIMSHMEELLCVPMWINVDDIRISDALYNLCC